MANSEIMKKKMLSRINMKLLPIKIHYLLAYGGISGAHPFLPVLMKDLNISATALGITYTVIPIAILFSKPLFGAISDHFQNIKQVIIGTLSCTMVLFLLILTIPPIQFHHQGDFSPIICQDVADNITLPARYDTKCLLKTLDEGRVCNAVGNCDAFRINQSCTDLNVSFVVFSNASSSIQLNICRSFNETSLSNVDNVLKNSGNSSICSCLAAKHLSLSCLEICSVQPEKEDSSEIYRTVQFWVIFLLVLLASCGSAAIFSLSDAACYELLDGKIELYGRQRLYATASCGSVALIAGYFNDLATSIYGSITYAPGFIIMATMIVLDLIMISRFMDLKQNSSQNIWSNVGSLFSSCRVITFSTGVLIAGGLTGLVWNYQFWYLQNLGASQMLLGLTMTVQCLAAEVPFFFFSGWIIERLGHSLCLIFTFLVCAVRYFLYYFLTNPWYTLPIEVFHGWTFGVFYATMTSFAKHNAPLGTEATMQGVFGGLYEGLGVAIGSLLAGVGFDHLGGRHTFLTFGAFSALCSVAFSIVTLILRRTERTK